MDYNVSIISVSNNNEIMIEFKNSLAKQKNVTYQLIEIDNVSDKSSDLKSAWGSWRKAINSVLNQIKYDLVIFSHPDIRFLDEKALVNILSEVNKLSDFGVVGVAGCQEGQQWSLLTNIFHGELKKNAGIKITTHIEVQTVDECFFIMKNEVLQKVKFSNLDGWHLYAVEQCLHMLDLHKKNYIVPANLWHLSDGKSLDPQYMICLEKIIKRYSKQTEYLNTTVKQWKTHGVGALLYRRYYFLKQSLKRGLKQHGMDAVIASALKICEEKMK